jgi:hypothetical protein
VQGNAFAWGTGAQCSPTMADTKMDSSVHACTVMPAGIGTRKRSATPSPTAAANGTGFAPCSDHAHAVRQYYRFMLVRGRCKSNGRMCIAEAADMWVHRKVFTGHLCSFPSASADADACKNVDSLSKIACCDWHRLTRNANVRRVEVRCCNVRCSMLP